MNEAVNALSPRLVRIRVEKLIVTKDVLSEITLWIRIDNEDSGTTIQPQLRGEISYQAGFSNTTFVIEKTD